MLESVHRIAGNGRVDSTGAEQENGLLEQRSACLGHDEGTAGVLEERHHGGRGLNDLVHMRQ